MLDPEELARAWVPGRGPAVVRLLARGPEHATYRVRRDGRSYALRVPLVPQPPAARRRAVARAELQIVLAAGAAGIGPAVARGDPAAGILVTEWQRGRAWTRSGARDPANAPRIAALVRRIQALQPGSQRRVRRPVDWIRHYRRALARAGAAVPASDAALSGEAARRAAAFARLQPRDFVLCHSDLHRLNLLEGPSGLVAIDWEYAHYSDPYWDLAGWLSVNDLGEAYGRALLSAYLGRRPDTAETQRLGALCWLYDYVCLLWTRVHARDLPVPAAASAGRRANVLHARLVRASGDRVTMRRVAQRRTQWRG